MPDLDHGDFEQMDDTEWAAAAGRAEGGGGQDGSWEGSVGGGNGVRDGGRRMGVGERGGWGGDGERLIALKAKIGDVSQELRLLKAAV